MDIERDKKVHFKKVTKRPPNNPWCGDHLTHMDELGIQTQERKYDDQLEYSHHHMSFIMASYNQHRKPELT